MKTFYPSLKEKYFRYHALMYGCLTVAVNFVLLIFHLPFISFIPSEVKDWLGVTDTDLYIILYLYTISVMIVAYRITLWYYKRSKLVIGRNFIELNGYKWKLDQIKSIDFYRVGPRERKDNIQAIVDKRYGKETVITFLHKPGSDGAKKDSKMIVLASICFLACLWLIVYISPIGFTLLVYLGFRVITYARQNQILLRLYREDVDEIVALICDVIKENDLTIKGDPDQMIKDFYEYLPYGE